jgi:hypothetical protein
MFMELHYDVYGTSLAANCRRLWRTRHEADGGAPLASASRVTGGGGAHGAKNGTARADVNRA